MRSEEGACTPSRLLACEEAHMGKVPLVDSVAQTSRWMAAARARESERPYRLFNDPLAATLAGPEGFAWLERMEPVPGFGGPACTSLFAPASSTTSYSTPAGAPALGRSCSWRQAWTPAPSA